MENKPPTVKFNVTGFKNPVKAALAFIQDFARTTDCEVDVASFLRVADELGDTDEATLSDGFVIATMEDVTRLTTLKPFIVEFDRVPATYVCHRREDYEKGIFVRAPKGRWVGVSDDGDSDLEVCDIVDDRGHEVLSWYYYENCRWGSLKVKRLALAAPRLLSALKALAEESDNNRHNEDRCYEALAAAETLIEELEK